MQFRAKWYRKLPEYDCFGGLMLAEGNVYVKKVPGVSLNGRKPKKVMDPEVKYWLACRGVAIKE